MSKRKSSYQRLKDDNIRLAQLVKQRELYAEKLMHDPEFYAIERLKISLTVKIAEETDRIILMGSSVDEQPIGIISKFMNWNME